MTTYYGVHKCFRTGDRTRLVMDKREYEWILKKEFDAKDIPIYRIYHVLGWCICKDTSEESEYHHGTNLKKNRWP